MDGLSVLCWAGVEMRQNAALRKEGLRCVCACCDVCLRACGPKRREDLFLFLRMQTDFHPPVACSVGSDGVVALKNAFPMNSDDPAYKVRVALGVD